MHYIFAKLFPKEVVNLIKEDGSWLWSLFAVGGAVAVLIGLELICLYLLGTALLGQSISIEAGGLFIFIASYLENLTQSELLIILGCTFSLVIVLRYGFILLYNYMSLKWTALVTVRLQNRGMESILLAPMSVYDKRKLGGIIHGLMEASSGALTTTDAVTSLITSLFTAVMICLTLLYISPWMVLGALVIGIPLFFGLAAPMQRKVRQLKSEFFDQRIPATELVTNVINGIQDIKSLNTESKMASAFLKKANIAQNAFARARFIKRLPGPTLQAMFQLAFAIIIIIAGFIISPENMTTNLPSLGVLGYGLFRIYPAITNVLKCQLDIHNSIPDLQITDELTNLPEDKLSVGKHKILRPFKGIRVEGVSFSYENSTPIFSDLNCFIEVGKTTSIVGGSGAGKSTFIDLILKFRSPQLGVICIGDQDLIDVKRASWLQNLGVVRQDVFFFGGTIRENFLAWNSDASDDSILLACKQSLALDFINEMPNGLDTILGDRGVTISGGQRQRLAIARAILRDPEILILDEALSALDGETEAKVMESLQLNSPHRTIILVSHRLASIVASDQILVLGDGNIIEQGNHEELKSMGGKYMELFESQIESTNSD
jgi:ABC-type bacteriocin/lantibiotic exporter with double-glycine peptidase domain